MTITGWDGKEYPVKQGEYANFILDGRRKNVRVHRMRVGKTVNVVKMMREFIRKQQLRAYRVDEQGVATNGDGHTIRLELEGTNED